MKKMLIVTTINDLSIPLFLENKVSRLMDFYFCFFHESLNVIKQKLNSKKFDFIYIKDPFTYDYTEKDLKNKINFIIRNSKKSYFIDNIKDAADVFFEDKFIQYKLFNKFMPQTNILSDMNFKEGVPYIIKKRISSRAKDIFFNKDEISKKDAGAYIIQERIPIEKEFRVYVIFGQIIQTVSIKRSKTETNHIKIVGAEKINTKLNEYVKEIIIDNKFDFIGLDIALSAGKYYLIEVNRGCQFNAFYTQTKTNLAELFIKKLLKIKGVAHFKHTALKRKK